MAERGKTLDELIGPLNEVERKNAPRKLFLAGDEELLRSGPRVSIVGSRKASPEALSRARFLARALVKRGIVAVSGLAEGIDTAGHEAALAEAGRTIAVIGRPLNEFYPAKNRALQERLMREQLVVSQFPVGYPSKRENFPRRNRTMALISDATVIVEAGEKSGRFIKGGKRSVSEDFSF